MAALTDLLDLPKPDSSPEAQESVADAFLAVAAALDMLDAIVHGQGVTLSGKAEASHGHTIGEIDGLTTALAGKRDNTTPIGFGELSGVTGLSAAPIGYVLTKSETGGVAFISPAAAIGDHQHPIGDITGLTTQLDGKVNLNGANITSKETFRASIGLGSMATRNLFVSATEPGGMVEGDIWLEPEA